MIHVRLSRRPRGEPLGYRRSPLRGYRTRNLAASVLAPTVPVGMPSSTLRVVREPPESGRRAREGPYQKSNLSMFSFVNVNGFPNRMLSPSISTSLRRPAFKVFAPGLRAPSFTAFEA